MSIQNLRLVNHSPDNMFSNGDKTISATQLLAYAKKLETMITTSVTQCNGYKCREPHCISCNSKEDAREWLKDVREYIEELS